MRSRSSAAGIPAVEFGPEGAGHHGPEEWVSVSSLARYRRALGDFVRDAADVARAAAPRPARRDRGRDEGDRRAGRASRRLSLPRPVAGALAVRARRP